MNPADAHRMRGNDKIDRLQKALANDNEQYVIQINHKAGCKR